MNVQNFPALSACRYCRLFLLKSYSLELMLSLLEKDAEGLDELRKGLYSRTPQLPAFLDYISLLESRGCVSRVHGKSKKSANTEAYAKSAQLDRSRTCQSRLIRWLEVQTLQHP